MSDPVKVALIVAGAIIVGIGAWIYFSPYQTCLRARAAEAAVKEDPRAANPFEESLRVQVEKGLKHQEMLRLCAMVH